MLHPWTPWGDFRPLDPLAYSPLPNDNSWQAAPLFTNTKSTFIIRATVNLW